MSSENEHQQSATDAGTAIAADTVTLEYDRVRDHLHIGGRCNSLDLMMDMLHRAMRNTEARLREQQALELQQKMIQAQQDAAIAAALRKR